MRKVANVVHDFTGLSVSTQHMYNHVRKWRVKWNVISMLKNEGKLKWCDVGTCFVLKDDNLHEHL
jgi:protein associated with RNAse G/E